jgi:acetolactate synthase-1/2/3 large subunit
MSKHLGMGRGRLHELSDQRHMMAGVAAFSHTLLHPENLQEVMAQAFTVFYCGRPRPVHIEIPIDVLLRECPHPLRAIPDIPRPPVPNPRAVQKAAQLLNSAAAPMAWLGGGACDASKEARQLIEFLDAPTVNTTNGTGVLPTDHPLSIGTCLGFRPVADALRKAEVVLAVGTELGETDTFIDGLEFEFDHQIIRVDIDPLQISRTRPADVAVLGDARLALEALNTVLETPKSVGSTTDSPGSRRARQLRQAARGQWWPGCMAQKQVMDTIQNELPEVCIVGDSNQLIYNTIHSVSCHRPRAFFHGATGFGTLGYALPASIGVKIAKPDRPVVAIIGDGGFQFTLPELAAAVEAKTPLVIILWNNQGFGEIRKHFKAYGIPFIGTQQYTPDFLRIARGFGCGAYRARSWEDLSTLLRQAMEAVTPTLIEIRSNEPFITEEQDLQ